VKRLLSITAVLLVLAQALAAAVPMLHPTAAAKTTHAHGKHDCCPKPVVEVRNCCPLTVTCPHQQHSAGTCCCADSGDTPVPSRKTIGNAGPALAQLVAALPDKIASRYQSSTAPSEPPPDNSPPVLVLRN